MAFDFEEQYEEAVDQHYRKLRWVRQSYVRLQIDISTLSDYIENFKEIRRKGIILREKLLDHPTWGTIEEIKMLMDKYEKNREGVRTHGF